MEGVGEERVEEPQCGGWGLANFWWGEGATT